ncbi:TolC family protein [Polynucleobacter sp. JS-Polo-80-F4]|uniref:TolC family protein n=1 Tax=Polynucleobacter sp. JS-Polo-80-F4 TaxID=2576918 RepID=UPI001C0ADA82|nr:TolC family protein [Polynucleobacter sp. JS-Polo-80-F4]MBU3617434.1 TolC family protein [Polynucleobacter sp. JS-Polo-80-F4]
MQISSKLFTSFFLALLSSSQCLAQTLPAFTSSNTKYRPISLSTYIGEVNLDNPTIKVKKLGTDSASSAAKQAGRPYLSPILTYVRGSMYTQTPYVGYANPSSNTYGASITVEGWGKRSARQAQAQADLNRQMAEALTEAKSVETQAIFAYIDALRTKLLWQSYQAAIDRLKPFASDEAIRNNAEFKAAQGVLSNDLKFYSYTLVSFVGDTEKELPLPLGTLNIPPENFNVKMLISEGLEKRIDIHQGKASIESATANLEAIKANKGIDLMPGIYYTETPAYSTSGLDYGAQKSFSFLLSIPIGNGFMIDSDVIAGSNSIAEQEVNLVATKTKVITEINQTYLQYEAAKERLEKANIAYSMAKTSKSVGLKSVLELREAEYELFDARTVHAKTLILLKRLSGHFDIPNLN